MLFEAIEYINGLYERYPFMAAMLFPLLLHVFFFHLEVGYFRGLSRNRCVTAFIGLAMLLSIMAGILLLFSGLLEPWQRVIFFLSFPAPLMLALKLADMSNQRAKRGYQGQ